MALTTNINYLQPTAFKVVIDRRTYGNLEYFAQSVDHPSLSLPPAEVPFRRINSVPMPGDKLTYSDLSITMIVDENMSSYTEMHDWIVRLVEQQNVTAFEAAQSTALPSTADITVSILSSSNNQIKQIRYIDCVPTGLGNINFTSTTGDIQYLTYVASFRYSYFTLV